LPGELAPPGLGFLTGAANPLIPGGGMAELFGTKTAWAWFTSGFEGAFLSGASFTGLEVGIQSIAVGAMNWLTVGAFWEGGVLGGSMISAIPVGNQTLSEWLAGQIFWNPLSIYADPNAYIRSAQPIITTKGRISILP
jgi:hypothetical protein